jgi:hypothetical protein
VGSECVKHFGIEFSKPIAELIKEAKRLRRLDILNTSIPGIENEISQWNTVLESFPILIPLEHEKPYLNLGNRIKGLYDGFLDSKGEDDILTLGQMSLALAERDHLIGQIQSYVHEHISRKYAPSQEIAKWLRSNGLLEALEWLKQDGMITWRTAHRIEHSEFMKLIKSEFNEALDRFGCVIDKIDRDYRGTSGYVVRFATKPRIRLFCKHSEFVKRCGGVLFDGDQKNPYEMIVTLGQLYDELSIDQVVEEIDKLVDRQRLFIESHDFEFNDVVFREARSGDYIVLELKPFVEQFKCLVFGVKGRSVDELYALVLDSRHKRYSKEQIKDFRNVRAQF